MHNLLTISLASLSLGIASCASESHNAVQYANAHQACAEIGIDPASPHHANCAADLDAMIFNLTSAPHN